MVHTDVLAYKAYSHDSFSICKQTFCFHIGDFILRVIFRLVQAIWAQAICSWQLFWATIQQEISTNLRRFPRFRTGWIVLLLHMQAGVNSHRHLYCEKNKSNYVCSNIFFSIWLFSEKFNFILLVKKRSFYSK